MYGGVTKLLQMSSRLKQLTISSLARFQSTSSSANLGLDISSADQTLWIRFDRPQKFNAITIGMYKELTSTFKKVNQDKSIKAVVLTGKGQYYSSGNDLSNFIAAKQEPDGLKNAGEILFNFVESFINLEKFLIAAVNGPAVGIPVTTLPLCDYVLASDKATFTTPFTAIGQSPEACSSVLWPSIFGFSRANELLMLNKIWDAKKAKEYGLVSEVVEHENFDNFLNQFAKKLVKTCYSNSMLVTKSLIRNSDFKQELSKVNRRECDAIVKLWEGQECADALQNFFKRSKN